MRSEEESKCRCCQCSKDYPDFRQIMNLKNSGLVIYHYFSRHKKADVKSNYSAEIPNADTIIIHNTTNLDITTNKLTPNFGQYIKCRRCKYILEHAKKLLEKVSFINKFGIIGLCDHCQIKHQNNMPCNSCYEVVKKFIASKKTKEFNQWLSRAKKILKTSKKPNKLECRSLSESFLKIQSHCTWSPSSIRVPRIDLLSDFIELQESIQMQDQSQYKHFLKSTPKVDENLECKVIDENDKNLKKEMHVFDKNVDVIRTNENVNSTDLNLQEPFKKNDNDEAYKEFSYFFIKTPNKKLKSPQTIKNSSELIKDTQDMIRANKELKMKIQSEVIKKKLEQTKAKPFEIQKKQSYSKNKLLLEKKEETILKESEKKILDHAASFETEKLISGELSIKKKHEKLKKKINKESLTLLRKNKGTLIKSVPKKQINKELLEAEKESIKAKKEIEKKEKVEKLLNEREQKLKEKEQKEKFKKEQQRLKKNEEQLNKEEKSRKKDERKQSSTKDYIDEFKKMLIEQKKQKEEETKLKNKQEEESKKIRRANDNISKEEAMPTLEINKVTKPDKKSELKTKTKPILEESKTNELKISQVAIRKHSSDDLILKLVKLKQSNPNKVKLRPKRLSEIKIHPFIINAHMSHKNKKQSNCIICNDSELELDIDNIVMNKYESEEIADIIIGQKILKYNPNSEEKEKKNLIIPKLFTSTLQDDILNVAKHELLTNFAEGDVDRKSLPVKSVEQEVPKGVVRYALSDRTFIDKGWTMLPTEKVVRKMNVYRMRPAHPEFDWFEHNKNKKLIHYDTGEKLAEIDDNGRGRWFYRNGKLALDYYDAEEINAQQRFVIYSSGEADERGSTRPSVILATFDYLGNGIVFDHTGKIRLKYNQTEGVVLDRAIGPVSHWKWHTLNDPPVLQQVMIDTQMAHKDPEIFKLGGSIEEKTRPYNEEMLAIEFDNFIKEKSKKLSQKFKPFQIKMKALKINEHFSLKVLDQATVYLIFRDGPINLKINIGMILDHQEIVDTDIAEVGEVSNSLERFPARTDSLAGLQRSIAYAQRVERARIERERRLRPSEPCTDKVNTAISRPLHPPLQKVSSCSTVTPETYKCRKSSPCHLYYDTRL